MELLLVISIVLRGAAALWSLLLLRRLRDWRMGFFTLLLGFMAWRQCLTLLAQPPGPSPSADVLRTEWPGFVVSLLSFAAIYGLGRILEHQRRMTEELHDTRALYVDLYEGAPDMQLSVDADTGRIVRCNQTLLNSLGYERSEVLGRLVLDLYHPDCHEAARIAWETWRAKGELRDVELQVLRKDGRRLYVSLNAMAVCDPGGVILRSRSVWRDITVRKQAEAALRESEEGLRLAVEGGAIGLWRWEVATGELEWNEQMRAIFGIAAPPAGLTLDRFLATIHPSDRAETEHAFRAALAEHREFRHEYRIRQPDGTERWIVTVGRGKYDRQNQPVRMRGAALDVTARKQAEARAEHHRALLNAAIEASPAGIIVAEAPDARITLANAAALGIRGGPPRDLTEIAVEYHSRRWQTFHADGTPYDPEDLPLSRAILKGEVARDVDVIVRNESGEDRWVLGNAAPVRDKDGRIVAGVVVFPDITERKQAEARLAESNERFQLVARGTSDAVWDWDIVRNRAWWNEQFYERFDSDRNVLPSLESWTALIHPDDRERVTAGFLRAVERGGDKWEDEFRIRLKDGSYAAVEDRGLILRDAGGNPIRVLGAMTDITARKEAEALLRESEERLRLALDAAHMGTFDWDMVVNRITWTRWHEELWGYAPGEFDGTYEAFATRVHPEDLRRVDAEVSRCIRDHKPFSHEFRVVWPDGTVHWMQGQGEFTFDAATRPVRMRGVVKEITDRKQAEAALSESEERFAGAFHTSPAAFTITRVADGTFVDVNQAFLSLFEFNRDEVIGRTTTELGVLTAEERARVISAELESGGLRNAELLARSKSGRPVHVLFSSKPMDLAGEAHHITTLIDITERKRAETELVDSERRHRALFENMNAGFVLFEVLQDDRGHPVDLIVLAANEGFERSTGLKVSEAVGKRISRVLPGIEKDAADWIGTYGKVALTGEPRQFEQVSELLGDYYSIAAYQAAPRQCAVTFLDITKRRKAEAAVRESRERLRLLSSRLLEVQEVERRHLARELHDEIGQSLTAAKINLKSMERVPDAALRSRRLARAIETIDSMLHQVRSLSLNLRPPLLDDLGLVPALRWLVTEQYQRSGLRARFQHDALDQRFDPTVETACFRAAQEALTNVVRHANARSVEVELRLREDRLQLEVRDDGAGFDFIAAQNRATSGSSLGLVGMLERVSLAGGELNVDSAPGKGTMIRARFPADPPPPDKELS